MKQFEDASFYGVDLIKVAGKNVSIYVTGKDLNKLGENAIEKLISKMPSSLEEEVKTLKNK